MASSILLKFPRNTETVTTNAKTLDVKQALNRVQRPLESLKVSFEVLGVHALPDAWKNAIASSDPSEALYTYEIELAGIKMTGAKTVTR